MPTNKTDAATALNQQPPLQLQRDGLVLTLHIDPRGLYGSIWSKLVWDQLYSECVAHMISSQSHERLWGSAVGLSWEILEGQVLVRFVLRFAQIPCRDELLLNPMFKSPLNLQMTVLSCQAPSFCPLRYDLCIRMTLTHYTSLLLPFACFLLNSF